MGLFLPILLLGLAQPVDQPSVPVASPEMQVSQDGSAPLNPPKFTLGPASKIVPGKQVWGREPDRNVCYTMRSYMFERQDDLAPEMVGMTTCTPAKATTSKRIFHPGKLVPASSTSR